MSDPQKKSDTTDGNLDITRLEEPDEIARAIEKFYKNDSTTKTRLDYNWSRNHKFLDGDQWIQFDGDRESGGAWRRISVNKANEYIPRPVTNYLFDAYQTLKSYVIKNKPRSTVRPNTQTFTDKSAAKVAELVLETNWERLNEQANYEYAASCLLVYGTVFKKSFWDVTNFAGMAKVPRMEQQPVVDPNTGMPTGDMQDVQAVDPETGDALFDEIPLGDLNTEVVEPYRIALDPLTTDLHKARWIMEYSIQSLDWITETFAREGDGYTGRVEEVKEETQLSGSMRRFYQLKSSSGVRGTSNHEAGSGSTGDAPLTNSAVVKEYYERPSGRHPKGRLIVVANSIPLYIGDNPCEGSDQLDWHPYSECRWEIVPGRFHGKSPMDAACEIQKHINSIDSTIILTRKTMAIPQKLVPIGSGIAPGSWTGRPGQQIEYRETGGTGPSVLPSSGVDATVFQERAQRVEDLKNVMGAIDILKGDRPPGVNAASALSLLYEVGTGKLFPILDRWKKFVENDQKKQLKCVAKGYKEPREDFIAALKAKNTDLSDEMISRFIGTELRDNCNVIVEAGSNIPKLQAAQQSRLMEMAQVGSLNLELPPNRMEFNRQMGITGFDNDVGPDIKRAEWENDLLDGSRFNPANTEMVIVLDADLHDIHIEEHNRRIKEPSFFELPAKVQQAYMAHVVAHEEAKAAKEQAAAIQAMSTGQPPEQGQSPGAPQQLSGHGKGATKGARDALMQDAMVPGQMKR
jgi:hypothetical protein